MRKVLVIRQKKKTYTKQIYTLALRSTTQNFQTIERI